MSLDRVMLKNHNYQGIIVFLIGGITEKMKVRENSFFDMESLVGIIMSVCAKF